jgi:hypothetical protein
MTYPLYIFTITISAYTKKKQAIVLGRCIEDSADIIEMKPCSVCMLSGRKYIFNQTLSGRYSEYYRKQVSYNSLSDK